MKVSICLCTYNGEKYLKEQLQSIVNQTMLPDEIVVCDDCSTDKTVDILNDFAKSNPSIAWRIFVNEHNVGWKVNFRNCIERAEGDYIFLCDQDDIWKLDKIETMVHVIQGNDKIELLLSKYTTIYEKNAIDHNRNCKSKNNRNVYLYNEINKLTTCFYPGCGLVFSRRIKPLFFAAWGSRFPHDHILCAITQLRATAYIMDYISIEFRRHDNNTSSKYPVKRISALSKKYEYNRMKDMLLFCKRLKEISQEAKFIKIKIIDNQIKWLNYRIDYYEKPKIYKFIKLFFYKKYYRNFKNYLKDINALLYK